MDSDKFHKPYAFDPVPSNRRFLRLTEPLPSNCLPYYNNQPNLHRFFKDYEAFQPASLKPDSDAKLNKFSPPSKIPK